MMLSIVEKYLKKKGKKKGRLNHATQMNSIRIQLLKRTNGEETFGFVTKEHRQLMGLPKEHYFDAVAIATEGKEPTFKTNPPSCLKNVFLTEIISKPKVFGVNSDSYRKTLWNP